MTNRRNKILKGVGIAAGSLVLATASFFAGRATKEDPHTSVEIYRTNNQAYLVRVYNPQEGRGTGLEITDRNSANDFYTIGTDAYNSMREFHEKNPNVGVGVQDIDK